MTELALRQRSGLRAGDVLALLHYLETEGLLDHRECKPTPRPSLMARFAWPLRVWMWR